MAWDADRVQMLEKLWRAGLSASQIAKKLNGGVTRNAVIGKVHRMGFAARGQPVRRDSRVSRRTSPRLVGGSERKSSRASSSDQVRARPPMPRLQPSEKDIRILDLTDNICRWPTGDPQDSKFRFCGAPTNPSDAQENSPRQSWQSYCEYHMHMAYQRTNRYLTAQAEDSTGIESIQEQKNIKPRAVKAASGR